MSGETISIRIYEEDMINFLDDERHPNEKRDLGQRRTESFADVVHRIIIELQNYRVRETKERFKE